MVAQNFEDILLRERLLYSFRILISIFYLIVAENLFFFGGGGGLEKNSRALKIK